MALDRAIIRIERTGTIVPVLFNPEEYSVEDGNTFAEHPVPGRAVTPIQYVRGKGRTLSTDLFFDTSDKGEDVRRHTDRIVDLLTQDPVTLGAPVLIFAWGSFQMRCVLERVSQRFSRFTSDGLPVRAYLTVSFREYEPLGLRRQAGLFVSSPVLDPVTGARSAGPQRAGAATVSGVAASALGDPTKWRDIAELNGIENPRIPVAAPLRTPPRHGQG